MSNTTLTVSPVVFGSLALVLIDPGLSELKNFAPTIIMAFIIIWGVLKALPTWRDVKMRELEIREKEIAQRVESAVSTGKLADVLENIAVEQRQATEAIQVAQRVNVNSNEKLAHTVDDLVHSVDHLNDRMDKVEVAAASVARQG